MRRAVPLLLILGLLLQHLMLQLLPDRIAQQARALAHAGIHAERVAHHHHHDAGAVEDAGDIGDMHVDGRDAATAHVHADAGGPAQAALLMPGMSPPAALPAGEVRPDYALPIPPEPALDGLLRPPRRLDV